jgi:murein DD-endopeptidase MepM/ murein hydrolase activator NlpD
VDADTWRALVGIDLEQRAGSYDLAASSDAAGHPTATRVLAVVRRQFPRRVLTVAPDYVNPPPDEMKRITQENAFLADLYAHPADSALFRDGFERPVPGPANSSFGSRSVFNGQARSPHAGTDFLSGAGTPIHAPSSGRIVAARDLFFTGQTVIIDHGLGVFSMLAHLSRVDVQEGQVVARDAVVGLVGATGRVTGPHLHWAMRVGSARVDPLSALALLGGPVATP